jgi:UDP-N-acetylmuramate--alanine ligase
MNTKAINKVFFLGIGGIGMSAIARYFHFEGKIVEGYDRTSTVLTSKLEEEGISIHYNEDLSKVPSTDEIDNTLVIYTPAIPESNIEFQYFKNNGFALHKRSQVLGVLTEGKKCVAVAGTHGKTSVTTMTAHLLKQSEVECAAFMGGISSNYNTNLILPGNESDIVVAEADEFDRSFLQLHPELAVITSMDADHLDIYGNHKSLVEAFASFVSNVSKGGTVLYKKGLDVSGGWNKGADFYSYSISEEADFMATNIEVKEGAYQFDLVTPMGTIEKLFLAYPGLMNVENAVAACGLALLCGVTGEEIRKSLSVYKGVVRRFDLRYNGKERVYIDDYAHHPTELEATIRSVRDLYPGRKVTGVFQPHLFTRTRDFVEGFAASLDLLDEALLLDIYPAREEPIPGVDSGIIFNKMKLQNKIRCTLSEFPGIMDKYDLDVLITLGAGDIDTLVGPITEYMKKLD